jgi:hypothetical protein
MPFLPTTARRGLHQPPARADGVSNLRDSVAAARAKQPGTTLGALVARQRRALGIRPQGPRTHPPSAASGTRHNPYSTPTPRRPSTPSGVIAIREAAAAGGKTTSLDTRGPSSAEGPRSSDS